ncbi:MAG: KUP/HAK/KT family potassium transporter [Clostridiales bacterium]|nr:KUP/HAK/KT family potassium transporter [Candidatus Cacconaster stercorequi]
MSIEKKNTSKASLGMMLIAIGIVYGDIGTSPMYVMKSILEGNGGIGASSRELIIGSLSLVIWTITLLTTIKHVLIMMKADNHGEGGIFALYSLVKKYGKWLIVPAMIGGATMLADGVLTPAVTVTTAIEGLRSIPAMDTFLGKGQTVVLIITLTIIAALFAVQRAGTSKIGKAFGPVMLVWFSFLGGVGVVYMLRDLSVLQALNPLWAIRILTSPYNKAGFMILGSVFLSATGAEALYSDMGHVGRANIYASWPFVKLCLILNYAGQSAWLIRNLGNPALATIEDMNPFFQMLPAMLRPFAVIIGAAAAIIASQALITGSYTLVSEAISLDLMPHMQIRYPAETKGQLYIPVVNSVLWICCTLVVLYFRTSARMEAAYGLSITITMLTTTVLLMVYMDKVWGKKLGAWLMALLFGAIELVFFLSSLTKFTHGGYVVIIIAALIFLVMLIWQRGTRVEQSQRVTLPIREYIDELDDLRRDESFPLCADNVVFITNSTDPEQLDRDLLYSILDKESKRAKTYWFLNVRTCDEPYQMDYTVENYGTDFVFYVQFHLGYKIDPMINVYFRQVVTDLMELGELPEQNKKHSIYGPSKVGTFKFCMIHKTLPTNNTLSTVDNAMVSAKYAIRRALGDRLKWYGFENAAVIIERVPLFLPRRTGNTLQRMMPDTKK